MARGELSRARPDGQWRPLLMGTSPIDQFLPGWEPVGLHEGFLPLGRLELRHESGAEGSWFLDAEGRHRGDDVRPLDEPTRAALATAALAGLRRIRDGLLTAAVPDPECDPRQLGRLNRQTLAMLMTLSPEPVLPPMRLLDLAAETPQPPPPLEDRALDLDLLRQAVGTDWRARQLALLANGAHAGKRNPRPLAASASTPQEEATLWNFTGDRAPARSASMCCWSRPAHRSRCAS